MLPCAGLLFVQRDVPLLSQQGFSWSHRWPWISRDIFGASGRGIACANLKACAARHLHHRLHLRRRHRLWHPRRRRSGVGGGQPRAVLSLFKLRLATVTTKTTADGNRYIPAAHMAFSPSEHCPEEGAQDVRARAPSFLSLHLVSSGAALASASSMSTITT